MITALAMLPFVLGQAPMALKEAAGRHRILFGTAVAPRFLSDPDYARIVGTEFSQVEPENEMKFGSLHPRPDTDPNPYDFTDADTLVAFAKAHNIKVRGHCFVWHSQVSRWVMLGKFQPDQLAKILQSHINTVAHHYEGAVYAWDVVNEAYVDDGSLRHTIWYDRPGIGFADQGTKYIEQAFQWARQADRHAKLFYNDYSTESVNKKSDAIYAMVKDFRKRRVPIDGVGFQCHLDLSSGSDSNLDSIRQNFKRFSDLGLQVQITELDVRLPNSDAETLARQADLYKKLAAICASTPRFTAMQIWGFTDKHSWIPQFYRGSGWALLFDDNYKPKPAYQGVIDGLMGHSSRS